MKLVPLITTERGAFIKDSMHQFFELAPVNKGK